MKNSIYNDPIIFVTFPAGGCGLFTSSVISRIKQKTLTTIELDIHTGHAHPRSGTLVDLVSVPLMKIEQSDNLNEITDKLIFNIEELSEEYIPFGVFPSHCIEFNESRRIELFPNSKDLVIYPDSDYMANIARILTVFKNVEMFNDMFYVNCKQVIFLYKAFGEIPYTLQYITNIIDSKDYKLIFWLNAIHGNLHGYVNVKESLFMDTELAKTTRNNDICQRWNLPKYYNDTTVALPLSVFQYKQTDKFVTAISDILGGLTEEESQFAENQFNTYFESQPILVNFDNFVAHLKAHAEKNEDYRRLTNMDK